ncbi:unnamed protein product [Timema podura]|uniref:Peptidase S1 domain-containing protein n=1 Tax=Timema podura TaxID=61482 RepID=A0ABN7NP93_TIMPD|nr:unnamed protein product [Timema podura]
MKGPEFRPFTDYLCQSSRPCWFKCLGVCSSAETATVRLGSQNLRVDEEGRKSYTSREFLVHEEYNDTTLSNDIALIKLPAAVPPSPLIATLCCTSSINMGTGDDERNYPLQGVPPGDWLTCYLIESSTWVSTREWYSLSDNKTTVNQATYRDSDNVLVDNPVMLI